MKHPNVEKAYNKFVVERKDKTQLEFWKEYFEAKMFYEGKSKKDLVASVAAKKKAVTGGAITSNDDNNSSGVTTGPTFVPAPATAIGICSEINARSFKMASVYCDGTEDTDPYRRPPAEKRARATAADDNDGGNNEQKRGAPPQKLVRLPLPAECSLLATQKKLPEENEAEHNRCDSPTLLLASLSSSSGSNGGGATTSSSSSSSRARAQTLEGGRAAQEFQCLVEESGRIGKKDDSFANMALQSEYAAVKRACDKAHFLCTEVWSRMPSKAAEDRKVILAKTAHMQEMAAGLRQMAAVYSSHSKDDMCKVVEGLYILLEHTISKVQAQTQND